jgi:molybdenum cofactor synthesis domain-containing protein
VIRAGILTVSTSRANGSDAEDTSGATIRELVRQIGAEAVAYEVVPDDREQICDQLLQWTDVLRLDLVVTTGGTGISPTDVTPEATRDVIEKELTGIAEAMRAAGLAKTPRAMLSRATAGTRGRSLLVNLPGSPKGVRECLEAVLPVLSHAVEILQARPTDH